MRSCERPRKRSGSEALPSSVSNAYFLSIRTHGSSCRRRASSSLRRVSSFSALRSSSRAASHCSRVPILFLAIVFSSFTRSVIVFLCISLVVGLFSLRASARLRIITRLGNQTKIVSVGHRKSEPDWRSTRDGRATQRKTIQEFQRLFRQGRELRIADRGWHRGDLHLAPRWEK